MSKLLSPHQRRHNRTQPCWQSCDSSGKRKTHISPGNIMLGMFLMCLVGGSICMHTYTHVYGYICGSLRLVVGNLFIMPCLTYGRSVPRLTKAHRWGSCAQPACSQDALALPEEYWDYQWGTMPTRLLWKSWDYIWLSCLCDKSFTCRAMAQPQGLSSLAPMATADRLHSTEPAQLLIFPFQ